MKHNTGHVSLFVFVVWVLAACDPSDVSIVEFPSPWKVDARVADGRAPDSGVPDATGTGADGMVAAGPAELILNEVGSNLEGQHDLVELLVTARGTTAGWRLEKDYPRSPIILATLPDVVVSEGQLIVVHLEPTGTTAMGETAGVAQHGTAANYDGAWDFLGAGEDVQYSNRVLALRAPDGTVSSAVPFFRSDLSGDLDERPRYFPEDLQAILDEGLWAPACAPAPCSYESNLGDIAVDWTGVGTTPSQASVSRRADGANGKTKTDWQAVPKTAPFQSFGQASSL